MMEPLRVRRANVDDLAALRAIWISLRQPAEEWEKRLNEFQVVEAGERVVGAIGLQFWHQHALLFGEGFSDFSIADAARKLFWERIQALASHHGVFRLWTREESPFWRRWGFQPATPEILQRLPEPWQTPNAVWFTLELKNEEAVREALEKRFAGFMEAEKQQTARLSQKARVLKTAITVIAFVIGFLCFGLAFYLLVRRNPFGQ
ncbi:MAG TPA: hypothetical protein VFB55_12835 [Verrucomicrobiae bacterium]|nr:hypothetical protein [Verrucomicrobiae bacterium]